VEILVARPPSPPRPALLSPSTHIILKTMLDDMMVPDGHLLNYVWFLSLF